jgi:hypothetical protein
MGDDHVVRLIGVYAADGGIRGELAYIAGRYLKGQHCELCDITHSPIRRRKEWDEFASGLSVPIDLVHRNERDEPTLQATRGVEPCVVAQTQSGQIKMVLDPAALAQVTSVDEFAQALLDSLRDQGLLLPEKPHGAQRP